MRSNQRQGEEGTMKTLFEAVHLSSLQVKNRFVRSATRDGYADERGHVTKELLKIYENLALGGVGTIITGHAYVTDVEQSRQPGQMGIYDDSCLPGARKLARAVHQHGAAIILQISCIGAQTFSSGDNKLIWGPSAVADLATGIIPRAMRSDEISLLKESFIKAAGRAKEAGFDGIQIHGAHGYLLNKFLNPYYNQRTDQYGGSFENRARLTVEIYEGIRREVGTQFQVLIKVNCSDFISGGMEFDECRKLCCILDELGIDGVEVSGGTLGSPENQGPIRTKLDDSKPYFSIYAAQVAEDINACVLQVGGNRDPEVMNKILQSTNVAFFSMCRPLLHESDLIQRWQSGDRAPAKCISCNKCLGLDKTVCIFHAEKKKSDNDPG